MARKLEDKEGEGRDQVIEEDEPGVPVVLVLPVREPEEQVAELPEFSLDGTAEVIEPPFPLPEYDLMMGPEEVFHHLRLELRPVMGGDVAKVPFHRRPELLEVVQAVGRDLFGEDDCKCPSR